MAQGSQQEIIPSIIIQIANNIDNIKIGDTTPTRDFNFVEDTCSAFYQCLNLNIQLERHSMLAQILK